ncbi:hydrogenase formation protein HypD [Desulfotalea psychrophila]|uniref:Related to hydrogenase isoenzymes formation protein n=1 Tax=Desulfotalea psychrophila (strain LSv54 / DSM 12343) TaxID=177439 RepID=Q6API1_DESPS|nr:hydrogenase formation protein HypD [Desulfotalea psychrophila]CAG35743.1 related to hydrogenase isoenzymes formation protein [Desulfotalea psychrophila LSv54]
MDVINQLPSPEALLEELHRVVSKPIRLMVVCGTHNRAILRYGIREELPDFIELVAGPGCSVCVMPTGHVDAFVKVARQPDVITATCEDLLKVRGSKESLADVLNEGVHRVEIISSPRQALELAYVEEDKIVVYPAVGFEATAPSIAETILEAAQNGVGNFCVIPSIRLLPPTIDALLLDPQLSIQGLLCSDHINTISDTEAYADLARKHSLSCCIAGFEKAEILQGILSMVKQIHRGESMVDASGAMVYSMEETARARRVVEEVFFPTETAWRGLGSIAESGFVIRDELALYDATKRFNVRFAEGTDQCMCHCNEIISGRALPPDCPAFGMACTLQNPVGPCMISNEGICAAYFKYKLESSRFSRLDV